MHADFIVVGSGLTGAMAGQTLAETGAQVMMLDVGYSNPQNSFQYPDKDFIEIRTKLQEQRKLFLGNDFEGIPWVKLMTGAQLTPGRQFVVREVERWIGNISSTFF